MRSMSISGLLAMIIVGGLILDHWLIALGLLALTVLFLVCYSAGKAHR